MLDQHFLSFWIRSIHVLSMACLLGGAVLLTILVWDAMRPEKSAYNASLLIAAQRYEWLFWLAIGVQVITGIGNLGSFGPGLPPPDSAWGLKLTIKLLAVVLLIPISLVRTIAIASLYNPENAAPTMPVGTLLKGAWGFTSVFLGAIVLLAEALAHG